MNRRSAHTLNLSSPELLEDRIALSAVPANPLEAAVSLKGGPALGAIYTEYVNYVQSGGQGTFTSPEARQVEMFGQGVGVDVRFGAGNYATNLAQMQEIGMLVTAQAPSLGIIEGVIPIGQLPSIALDPNQTSLTPVYRPTALSSSAPSSDVAAVTLKGGPLLGSIYQEYLNFEQAGGQGTFTPAESGRVLLSGTSILVNLQATNGSYSTLLGEMQGFGMQVTATAAQADVIEGYLPIAQLPRVAADAYLAGMTAVLKPTAYGISRFA